MTTDETNRALRFRQGDSGAFNEIYEEFGTRIYRFCLRLSGDKDDAEDLTAEVFLAAYSGREQFRGRSCLSTWLYRIAVFKWNRMKRSKRSTVQWDDSHELAHREGGIEHLDIEQAIRSLPETLAQAFLLVKGEQLCYREAAEVLGIPQGTLQFRVHEASKRLRSALSEALPESPAEVAARGY